MKKFEIDGYKFLAENCIDGILVNPQLPEDFYTHDLSEREPLELSTWMNRSYVVAEKHEAIGKRDKRSDPDPQFPIPLP